MARLHLIADGTDVERVRAAVEGGVDAVHLRDPIASASDLMVRGGRLVAALAGRASLIVNDRLDVALALGAVGVQLGRRSLPLPTARRIAPGLRIGVSVHSVEEARAVRDADWLLLGTIYASGSHPGEPGAGLGLVRQVAALGGPPIIAIGGITATNASEVIEAGASGVAVISSILHADSPLEAARDMRAALEAR